MNFIEVFGRMFDRKTKRPLRVDYEGRLVKSPSTESEWLKAVIDKGGTVSHPVDLGGNYAFLNIVIPTIDSANISLTVAKTHADDYQDLDGATYAAGTGSKSNTFKLGGWRHIKVKASAAQSTAERTFYVRGVTL